MTQPKPVSDSTGRFASNQIIVDTGDLRVLGEVLATHGRSAEEGESIELLQLTRVGLGDLNDLDQQVPGAAAVREELGDRGRAAGYPEPTDLDVLLTIVRRLCDERGHALRAGKDRDVELVEGLPHWAGIGPPRPPSQDQPQAAAPITLLARDAKPGRRVRVGVLDTGIHPHPDLDGRYLSSDLQPPKNPVESWAGHALFVVGLIAQEAPGAIIEARRVLDDETGTSSAWELAKAMVSFIGTGVEILNVSLGCFTIDDQPPFLLERVVERTLQAGILIVAAAGNHGAGQTPAGIMGDDGPEWLPQPHSVSSPMWPAALPYVIAVGAAAVEECAGGFRMTRAAFTPPDAGWIKLWAQGVDLTSFFLDGDVVETEWTDVDGKPVPEVVAVQGPFAGFAQWDGTSFACGVVTGRLADMAQTSGKTVAEVYVQLLNGQSDGSCGRANVRPGVDEPAEG